MKLKHVDELVLGISPHAVKSPPLSATGFMPDLVNEQPEDGLNIVIPIGGIGSRFQKEGYRFPKPLINIVGRPMLCWLLDRLSVRPQDTVWVAVNESVENDFPLAPLVKKEYPKWDIRVLTLRYLTGGAAETLFIVTQSMREEHRQRRTISLDCDTIWHANILQYVRDLPAGTGACAYFEDTGNKPIFSYIRLDESDRKLIVELQEKKAISSHANTGAYIFPSAAILRSWAAKVLDSRLANLEPMSPTSSASHVIGGEFYTSHLIQEMIKDVPFTGLPCSTSDFSCVGTPAQLRDFILHVKKTPSLVKRRRFCFDLDQTLVGVPEKAGDYSTCPPIWKNIELVRELKGAGHHIIIQTARRMRTHNGNVGAVIADIGPVTFASLAKYDIPYDEIFFGKPWAHVYIDDLAVNANLDTLRETGWLVQDGSSKNPLAEAANAQKAGVVASRTVNHIQIVGDQLIKSSRSDQILGETYFYANIPRQLVDLFPEVYSVDFHEGTSTYSITMEKLSGVTFSHLVVGRSLTNGRLLALLHALHRIHTASPASCRRLQVGGELEKKLGEAAQGGSEGDIYANYNRKVSSRFDAHRQDYEALGPQTEEVKNIITSRLQAYEEGKRAVKASIIHGDSVFSNAILNDSEGSLRFFDVRCRLGEHLSMEGDVAYDLAKVFQSLQGYDHVLLACKDGDAEGWSMDLEDKMLLADLQATFWKYVEDSYGGRIKRQDIRDITASLLFSLIPLHRAEVRSVFIRMCSDLVHS